MTKVQRMQKARSNGGKACIDKAPPPNCPVCMKPMEGRSYHSYLGHLSFHKLADRYFKGDFEAMHKHLQLNGLAKQDPFPQNNAWRQYVPIQQMKLFN